MLTMKRSLLLISYSCFTPTILVSASSTTTNNHHETLKSTLEAQQYAQYGPTVFAPGGRLHGVESVAKEAMLLDGSSSSDSVSCGVFALHCGGSNNSNDDGEFVVFLGIGATSTYLHRDEAYYTKEQDDDDNADTTAALEERTTYIPLSIEDTSTSTTSITNPISILSPTLIVGAGGKAIDSTILLRRAMEVSLSMFANDNGGVDWFIHHSLEGINGNFDGCDPQRSRPIMGGVASVNVSSLARRVANMAQSSTQSMGGKYGRMLSVSLYSYLVFISYVSSSQLKLAM